MKRNNYFQKNIGCLVLQLNKYCLWFRQQTNKQTNKQFWYDKQSLTMTLFRWWNQHRGNQHRHKSTQYRKWWWWPNKRSPTHQQRRLPHEVRLRKGARPVHPVLRRPEVRPPSLQQPDSMARRLRRQRRCGRPRSQRRVVWWWVWSLIYSTIYYIHYNRQRCIKPNLILLDGHMFRWRLYDCKVVIKIHR